MTFIKFARTLRKSLLYAGFSRNLWCKVLRKKVLVAIPVFNEAGSIVRIIRELKRRAGIDILVIDDASEDGSSELAMGEKVKVIRLERNRGVGGAMQEGFGFALGRGYRCVVQMDGDGQHDPVNIMSLIERHETSGADVVIGARYHDRCKYKTPLMRSVGIKILRKLINFLSGTDQKVTDPTSGYRLFSKRAMMKFVRDYPQRCPEAVATFWLLKDGGRISEVPVQMRYRKTGRSAFYAFAGVKWFLVSMVAIAGEGVLGKRLFIDR